MRPLASVVIPSHNESSVIVRLLESLASMAENGELDVHVVCNGCIDDTFAVASKYSWAKVYALEKASKTAAINLGDQVAGDVFPRLYLDADIVVSCDSIRKVIEELESGPSLAASPQIRVELDGRPLVVRDYYNIFLRTPWVTDGFVGSGFYGVSREGRSRFTEFPDILNDDLYFRSRFSREECLTVADAEFTIAAPRTVLALVRAKARVHRGTLEFLALERERRNQEQSDTPMASGHAGIARRIVKQVQYWANSRYWQFARLPSLWRPLLSHSGVRVTAVLLSHRPHFGNRDIDWGQDRTTRDTKSITST